MDEDTPCTGEPARSAVAFIAAKDALYLAPVLVIDFYAGVD